jgi:esterase/lipase superfamily enzyme
LYRWIRSAEPNRPLHVVFLSWPSDGSLTYFLPLDIALLGQRSAANGFYLAQLASQLPETSPISFVGHSHGARLITSALHILGGGSVQEYRAVTPVAKSRHRIRAVLFAAAMDHNWLDPGERYGRMVSRADAVLNLRNREDMPLGFYPLRKFNSRPALARIGFTGADRRLLGGLNPKVVELDVTPLIGSGHLWQHYFNQPSIARAISPFVFFTDRDKAQPAPEQFAGQTPMPAQRPASSQPTLGGWVPVSRESMPVRAATD